MQKISLRQTSKALLISTALLAPSSLSSALAADYTVSTPTTVQNGGHPIVDGDTLIIGPNGSITTVLNSTDSISGTDNLTILNLGTISTEGDQSEGIDVEDSNTINNSGTISTQGDDSYGIYAIDGNTINNSGTISTQGVDSYGIWIDGNSNIVNNSGTISTSGFDSYGIFISSNAIENTINNTGIITVTGANSDAFFASTGTNGTILNNSGKIISIEGKSISFNAPDSELNLLAPSFIGGAMKFDFTTVNVTTGRSQSNLWDFSDGSPAMSFTNGGVPYAWNAATKQFATIDPTALSAASNAQAELVNSLSDVRRNNADENWWLSGFGSWSEYGANGIYNDYNIANGGVAIGANAQVSDGFSVGAMAGYGLSGLTVNSKWETSQTINSKGIVSGIYGDADFDSTFVTAALYAGILGNDSNRLVNDNLEANSAGETWGIDYATANYNSWFVSPELTIGTNIEGGNGFTFTPSVSAKYGYQSIDGYSETGATNGNATFAARTVQTFEGNVEIAASQKIENGSITYRGGLDYRQNIGASTASASIIGQTLNLPIDNSAQIIAYAGIDANYQLAGGAALNLSAKAGLGTNGYKSISGSISLGGKF